MDWLQWLTASGAVGALGVALATYLKTRPAMKAAQVQGEAALWARIDTLDMALKRERELCDERIARIEERAESAHAEMKGEIRGLRHDRNNMRQGVNFLLASIRRLDNADLSSIAEAAEEMIARGEQTLAIEKAALAKGGKL